jgi:hypothetical protein
MVARRFVVLRELCDRVHHGYTVSTNARLDLYLYLKANPDYHERASGLPNAEVRWLLGFEEHGDEHGWLTKAAKREAARPKTDSRILDDGRRARVWRT